jgi:hypothetical protein
VSASADGTCCVWTAFTAKDATKRSRHAVIPSLGVSVAGDKATVGAAAKRKQGAGAWQYKAVAVNDSGKVLFTLESSRWVGGSPVNCVGISWCCDVSACFTANRPGRCCGC